MRSLFIVLVLVVVAAAPAEAQKKKGKRSADAKPSVEETPTEALADPPSPQEPSPPSPPPHAAGPAPSAALDADEAFTSGRKLYSDLEYEQAVFRFQEVALRPQLSPTDRGVALAWLGVSYAGTGDLDAARRTFVDAARAEPSIELPVEVSPRLVELFVQAKQEAAALPTLVPEQQPTPPTPTTTTTSDGGTTIAAAVGTAAGGALVVAGVGLAVLCALSYGEATDRNATQLKAKAALDVANLELAGASLLLPVGAAIGGVSTYFLLAGDDQGAAPPSAPVKSTVGRTTAPAATSTVFVTSRPL